MKRYFTILTIAFAAVWGLASCNDDAMTEPEAGSDSIILSIKSDTMTTKADDETSEVSFEDAIDHFDYFFFNDAAGTEPATGMHGYASGSSKVLATGIGEAFEDLRKGTHYVYILANYPSAIDHTHDWELEDILALAINSPIAEEKIKAENPETHAMEETGAVRFCNNLVMDSYAVSGGTATYTTELTPASIREQREVNVGLSRVAVKLSLTLNIESSVAGTIGDTWTPILKDLQAYYVNALNNRSTVSGAPVNRAGIPTGNVGDYEYFTYPTAYSVDSVSATTDVFTYVAAPVYTYPQEWESGDEGEPYFKVFLPWYSNKRGSSNFYYKISVPKPASGTKWTLERNTCYDVTVDLAVVDTGNDYIEVDGNFTIQDWASGGQPGGSGLAAAKFFDVPEREFTLYSSDNVLVPFSSSSQVSFYFTKIKYSYYGASDGIIAEYVFNFTKEENFTGTLPTRDSSNQTVVEGAKDNNSYSLSLDNRAVKFEHSLNGIYTSREITFVIENTDGRSAEITVIQHPSIEIKTHNTKNGFVNGWFARATADVTDAAGNLMGSGPYTANRFGGGQFYHATDHWVISGPNGSASGYPRIDNVEATGRLGIVYGDCTTSVDAACMFITEVTVSAFNTSNDSYTITYEGEGNTTRHYRIGDPRVPASNYYTSAEAFNIPKYLYSDKSHRSNETVTENVLKEWEEPLSILIANKDASANAVIAPRFLVSSNMNNMSNWPQSNETCVRRAATYQEAGYPAGRWRLPTEAEINFMMTLQQQGIIPQLYAYGSSYQCANGRAITITASGTRTSVAPKNCYIRFVYDLWYWGDDPTTGVAEDNNMTSWEKTADQETGLPNWKAHWADYYHANMHEH